MKNILSFTLVLFLFTLVSCDTKEINDTADQGNDVNQDISANGMNEEVIQKEAINNRQNQEEQENLNVGEVEDEIDLNALMKEKLEK